MGLKLVFTVKLKKCDHNNLFNSYHVPCTDQVVLFELIYYYLLKERISNLPLVIQPVGTELGIKSSPVCLSQDQFA